MLKHLRFDIFELQETKLPVRRINTTYEWRLVQGHEITPLRVKRDIEDVSYELDNGVTRGLLATEFVNLSLGEVTRSTPQSPHQRKDLKPKQIICISPLYGESLVAPGLDPKTQKKQ
ncbi:hypothetical protein TNCV_3083231 [Trichonephila clavipes]|nr:hypothetical protein TNCV_3083231 [Trichonephila clavipes]